MSLPVPGVALPWGVDPSAEQQAAQQQEPEQHEALRAEELNLSLGCRIEVGACSHACASSLLCGRLDSPFSDMMTCCGCLPVPMLYNTLLIPAGAVGYHS